MTEVPADELRRQAHELRHAVNDGDQAALNRVLAAHPKYAGRPAARLRSESFSLRDAQVTIARENGHSSWSELDPSRRWRDGDAHSIWGQATKEASQRGHSWCGPNHVVLALLAAAEPTVASQVLAQLGLRYDDAARKLPPENERDGDGLVLNPAFLMCRSFADGVALAMGEELREEHVLLALAYYDDGRFLTEHNLDPDDVYEALVRLGVRVPSLRPPIASPPSGPMGPRVYFPRTELSVVLGAFGEHYPPGTSRWGFNHSRWRPGDCWIDSEDEIDAAAIVAGVVADATLVEVVAIEIASRAEAEARATKTD